MIIPSTINLPPIFTIGGDSDSDADYGEGLLGNDGGQRQFEMGQRAVGVGG